MMLAAQIPARAERAAATGPAPITNGDLMLLEQAHPAVAAREWGGAEIDRWRHARQCLGSAGNGQEHVCSPARMPWPSLTKPD